MQIYEKSEQIEKKRRKQNRKDCISGHGWYLYIHRHTHRPNPSNFLFNFEIQNTFFNFDAGERKS